MLKSTTFRRHYLSMGCQCVKDENKWKEMVHDVLKRENIMPTPEHYKVLDLVRYFYLEKERAPSVKEICEYNGLSFSEFFSLFPDWPHTLFIIDSIVAIVLDIPIWNVEI
ncbi:MAG: hypothetical protein GXY91_10615 [Clostridia bacterium]|nr:hypothetical protein [Clostridia bacterium]